MLNEIENNMDKKEKYYTVPRIECMNCDAVFLNNQVTFGERVVDLVCKKCGVKELITSSVIDKK